MINFGVIGIGSLGYHHARILSHLKGVNLVGINDIDVERGIAVAEEFGVNFYKDLDELIEKCDALSVVTPTVSHFEVARKILLKGKHCFLEKPVTHSLETAYELARILNSKRGILLQVGHIERFNPSFLAVQPIIKKVKYVETKRLSLFSPRCTDVDVIFDLMIHDIDLILNIIQDEISEIKSIGIPILTDKIDIANVRLEFKGGAVANLSSSRVSSKKVREFRIFQEKNYISIDLLNKSAKIFTLVESPRKTVMSEKVNIVNREPLLLELESFVNSIETGKEVACSILDGIRALEVATKISNNIKMI